MSGLQSGKPARDIGYNGVVQTIVERITFAKENTIVDFLKKLPPNAHVLPGSGVHIINAFNDSGTDTLDIGFRDGSTTDDPDGFATLLLVSAIGFIALDELAAVTNIMQTKECFLTWRYNGANNDATDGVADIVINYVAAP